VYRARSRGQDRSWREAPLTDPKHAATARISRHGREGISYPSVEYHLHKVFRKLGIAGRRDLRDALAEGTNQAGVGFN